MRAITEIPANTPKPIGRTDSFFPGSVNAAACEVAGETAAAGATGVGEADKLLEEDAGGGVAAGTVDTPYHITVSVERRKIRCAWATLEDRLGYSH